MKKIIIFILVTIILSSCFTQKEDKIISESFLIGSFNSEYNELDLSNQELTKIPNFQKYLTGAYVDNIWTINLSNNKIKEVNGEYFKYFPNLKEINLSYNQVENIKIEHNFLKTIFIHKNSLKKVDLLGLSKLNTVNLGYNKLEMGSDIKLPNSIETLELQHNKLKDIIGIGKLVNISKLKLEFNKLEDSDLKELVNLKKLKFISVGMNKLSKKAEKKFIEFNAKNK